jgi:signal transduction histidine kinase
VSSKTIERGVVRDHVAAVLALAITIVLVSTIVAGSMVVRRDDREALAQAHSLGSELTNHASDGPEAHDRIVVHELTEHRWFGREMEVWRGTERVGGSVAESRLQEWSAAEGCQFSQLDDQGVRVCGIAVGPWHIVEARAVSEILSALEPLVLALLGVTLVATASVAWWSSRSIRVRIAPLSRLDEAISGFQAVPGQRLPPRFGAREIDDLAATMNDLLGRIDAAVERERRFVADAAHELRTPLTRLWGQIEVALAELGPADPRSDSLRKASRTCAELARTTEALLALAREERSVDVTVDLAELCSTAAESLTSEDRERVQILGSPTAPVRGDDALLKLALINVFDNAAKYASGPILVTTELLPSRVRVWVDDEGPGLSPEALVRVLNAFVRDASTAQVRGTGLGLALVDHVARLHGGSLALENRPTGGLRVAIEIPRWTPRTLAGDVSDHVGPLHRDVALVQDLVEHSQQPLDAVVGVDDRLQDGGAAGVVEVDRRSESRGSHPLR